MGAGGVLGESQPAVESMLAIRSIGNRLKRPVDPVAQRNLLSGDPTLPARCAVSCFLRPGHGESYRGEEHPEPGDQRDEKDSAHLTEPRLRMWRAWRAQAAEIRHTGRNDRGRRT